MRLDVKPLVWTDSGNGYRKAQGWGCEYHLSPKSSDVEINKAAANAHHAAHVRSQVAGVRLSDDEAYTLASAYGSEGIQAAIAAMGVGE